MSLGTLSVNLVAQTSSFTNSMDRAARKAEGTFGAITAAAKKMAGPLAAIGGTGFLVSQIKSAAEFNDAMGKVAQTAGASVEEFSKLAFAGKLAGVSNQELAKALRDLGNDAENGGKKLQALGISVKDANGNLKTSDELFKEVATTISGLETEAQKAAVATQVFGRAGANLVPLLNGGASALEDSAKKAEKWGQVVNEQAVKEAERFNDSLTVLAAGTQAAARTLAGPMVTSLGDVIAKFIEAREKGSGFWTSLGVSASAYGAIGERLNIDDATRDVERLQKEIKQLSERSIVNPENNAAIQFLNKQLLAARENVANLRMAQRSIETSRGWRRGFAPTSVPEPETGGGGSTGPARQSEAEKYLETLQRQLEATDNLTVTDSLLRDIQLGRLGKVSELQRQNLLGVAEEIDQRRWLDAELDQAIAKEEELRRVTENRMNETTAKAKRQAEETRQAYVQLGEQIGSSIGNNLEQAIMSGAKFKDVIRSIIQDMMRLAIQKTIVNSLTGGFGSMFGSMFGGGKALGGPVKGGTSYLVGERGPELFTPGISGNITPNSGVGGNVGDVHVHIHGDGSTKGSGPQEGQVLARLVGSIVKTELINQKSRPGGLLYG
jgi:hypothetical protein